MKNWQILLIVVVVALAAYLTFGNKSKKEANSTSNKTKAPNLKTGTAADGRAVPSDLEKIPAAQISAFQKWANAKHNLALRVDGQWDRFTIAAYTQYNQQYQSEINQFSWDYLGFLP